MTTIEFTAEELDFLVDMHETVLQEINEVLPHSQQLLDSLEGQELEPGMAEEVAEGVEMIHSDKIIVEALLAKLKPASHKAAISIE